MTYQTDLTLETLQQYFPSGLNELKESGKARLVHIQGGDSVIIQDAKAYQRLVEQVERAEAIVAIQEGIQSMKEGRGRPYKEVLSDLKRAHNPRSSQ